MKSYYNLAIAMKGIVAGLGLITGFDAVRHKVQYNDNFGVVADIALIAACGVLYYYSNKVQKREEGFLSALNAEKPGKTLENKLKPKQVPFTNKFELEKITGSTKIERAVYSAQNKKFGE